jgi:hypothetical protein
MEMSIPELELQQEVQRFTSRFLDRITQATEVLQDSAYAETREEALRKNLLYSSSVMEIATGASAAINLLDMFVFIRLSRTVLEQHWVPMLYGPSGDELVDAFAKAEAELTVIADRALGRDKRERLTRLVDTWLADNPGQIRVEGIRLADFSAAAGTAAADRALQARGLLSSVRMATEAANQAMLLAERGMFLFHRLPFLWRLQVRLGAREVIDDSLTRVTKGPGIMSMARLVKRGATYAALLGATALLWRFRAKR